MYPEGEKKERKEKKRKSRQHHFGKVACKGSGQAVERVHDHGGGPVSVYHDIIDRYPSQEGLCSAHRAGLEGGLVLVPWNELHDLLDMVGNPVGASGSGLVADIADKRGVEPGRILGVCNCTIACLCPVAIFDEGLDRAKGPRPDGDK